DALGGEAIAEIRDGVSIDPKMGTASPHAKYDLELWPPGTRFPIRLDLAIAKEESSNDREARLLALLTLALEEFDSSAIRLGARGRRGMGRCRLESPRARRFDLDSLEGWKAWLATWREEPDPNAAMASGRSIAEAIEQAWPSGRDRFAAERERRRTTATRELRIDIPLRFSGGVLIRAPGASEGGSGEVARSADVRHLRSGRAPILSGTSVAGALRQRALRIARFVRARQGDAEAWIEELFGTSSRERGQERKDLRASRLTVEEVPLSGATDLQVTRIKLDRFTQAPVAGGLIQEEPAYGAGVTLQLRLRLPDDRRQADALCGLLLLGVKDLLLGDVPLGGATGIGRGSVCPAGPVS
ncbi:MAG: RAMP superfamily CRISPR-associated protein, partial [Actinomycetota bacterium]